MLHILNVSNHHAPDLGGVYHWHANERIRVTLAHALLESGVSHGFAQIPSRAIRVK